MKKRTNEGFIESASKIHDGRYDYSKTVYVNKRSKVIITCPVHGDFEQLPSHHLNGHGCPKCARESIADNERKYTTKTFIEAAESVHGKKYTYTKAEYKNNMDKVCVTCPEHGDFLISPYYHLKGRGCPKCSRIKASAESSLTEEEFIKKANSVHNGKYDYSMVNYVNNHTKVSIICPEHGKFSQMPYSHLCGKGCIKCSNNLSKAEYEIIDFIGNEICEHSNKEVLGGKELDIYIPSLKTAIEFDGLRWHSEEFGKSPSYHLSKTQECAIKGIRLIHIFEDEWLCKKDIVKSRLDSILGRTKHKVYARNCILKDVSAKDANVFLDANHIQGRCCSLYRYGLYDNGEMVALMTFGKLRKNLGSRQKDGCFELLRFCSKTGTSVVGGAGKLFTHFVRTVMPETVISYADRRWSEGGLYEKLGFSMVRFSYPSYFYVVGNKRENRFKYRKDVLVREGFDPSKSEHQIMLDRGIYRIYDCGTMVFEYINNDTVIKGGCKE